MGGTFIPSDHVHGEGTPFASSEIARPFPFMRLPPELRCIVYRYNLQDALHDRQFPHALVQAVYHGNLGDVSADHPLPLLQVNKQMLNEFSPFLKQTPIVLRVTEQGMALDCLGLSACIAQGIHGDFSKISSDLNVEIWPPRADRPVEMLYIWHHMRRLRDVLEKLPGVRSISLNFKDNELSTWTCKVDNDPRSAWRNIGQPRVVLPCRWPDDGLRNGVQYVEESDLKTLLDLFATSANFEQVSIILPASLPKRLQSVLLRDHAITIQEIMTDHRPPVKSPSFLENLEYKAIEHDFKRKTAQISRQKLADITFDGKFKMSEESYEKLVRKRPYFETLVRFGDKKFEGKWHYVEAQT